MTTYTQEQIIQLAQQCWPSDRRMWAVDANLPGLLRFVELAAPSTSQWLPIETAPKDGSEFLARWAWYGGRIEVLSTYWDKRPPLAEWRVTSLLEMDVGFKPTHWMPLPPPAK